MKKIGLAKVLLVSGVLIAVFFPSFARYQELRHKNKKLEERIEYLNRENKRLASEKLRLETDITYIERRAREKLGVVRKGEIVLKDVQR